MRSAFRLFTLSFALTACTNDQTIRIRIIDAGVVGCRTDADCPQGPPPQHCLNGKCQPYCVRDDQCASGECCDFISGTCLASACRATGQLCVDGDRRCKEGTVDTYQQCASGGWV